jgi:N-acetylglutamate synthase-like GNAT family acetyltransferase
MQDNLTIAPLAIHPEFLTTLAAWFESEWPEWYLSGRGNALQDLRDFSGLGRLPLGVVAILDGSVVGIAALKAESITSHKHLTPWAAAGLVTPSLRGRGIGLRLVQALEEEARRLGFTRIYCATGSAENLLKRSQWQDIERTNHDGKALTVFAKTL